MNIVFFDVPSLAGFAAEKTGRSTMPSPYIGILYIAACLIRQGANVFVKDMPSEGLSLNDVRKIIKDLRPSIVGITCKSFNVLMATKVAEIVKAVDNNVIVLLGGAHPTALPELTLSECSCVDAVVLREGEGTILEMYERVKKGACLEDVFVGVSGILWRNKEGEIIRNKERSLIKDLDSLPFPEISLVDYDRYSKVFNPVKYKMQHVYPVFGSRGCPFNCTFCMPLHTRTHRVRSIDNILDEVELLHRMYNAERVYFEDSLFCAQSNWFERFCETYMLRGLHKKVQWGFETRIDTATADMFRQAQEAGCIYSSFGVESGSGYVLKKANKGYTREAIFEKLYAAKNANIAEVQVSLIIGLPYETKETIEETISLVEELPCDGISINILDIYPGTAVSRMADSGEGGLRWIEGKRMNWDAFSRDDPQCEVNDVDSNYLLNSLNKAKRLASKKDRQNKFKYVIKLFSYFLEFLKNDRAALLRYGKEVLRGSR